MKDNLTRADVTPKVVRCVTELIACMAIAQVKREEVNAVQREVLGEFVLMDTLTARHTGEEPQRITEPDQTYHCEDDARMEVYYNMVDARLRLRKIKPADMDRDHCPALVAEYEQTKAEWALLDAAAEMLEVELEDGESFNNRLLCRAGLDGRQEMLDLLCKIVVNL